MELIERYIHEVGRHLPSKNRSDIQIELRSLLNDALEDQAGEQPSDADVIAALKKFGSPHSVAAKYYPQGQYLIGPSLYPLFKMVTGIVIAVITGVQIFTWLIAYFIAGEVTNPLGLIGAIPSILGTMVIVFFILQRFDVQPDEDGEDWDPAQLPVVDAHAGVNRGELIFSIIIESILLSIVITVAAGAGSFGAQEGSFFGNPLLAPYMGWIILSLLLGICLDINLVWQGRWTTIMRWAKFGANLFSLGLLAMLVYTHMLWLQERGVRSLVIGLEFMVQDMIAGGQIISVWGFWIGFSIALIVTIIETMMMLLRLLRSSTPALTPGK